MQEESSGSNVQRLKIGYQPVHCSLYLPPPQPVLQQEIVQPAAILTYPPKPDTSGVRNRTPRICQQNVSKNRVVTKKGRVHFTRVNVIPEGEPVMMGVFSIVNQKAVILFDSGASHTFINRAFAVKYQLPIEVMDNSFCIQSPGGRWLLEK
jgi:hypothetical protein